MCFFHIAIQIEKMENSFPVFDHRNTDLITSYDVTPAETFVSTLVDSYNQQDENHSNDPKMKIPLYAGAIQGFSLLLEKNLYQIEHSIRDKSVSIQTLPHHTGNDHELISVIQPTAWILNDEGCYYDPVEQRIMRNSVGHWEGRANSIKQHIFQTITNSCFMTYHFIVLIAIIGAIMIKIIMENYIDNDTAHGPFIKNMSVILIISVAVGYDLIAMLFIIIMETYFPDSGKPWIANRVQSEVFNTIGTALNQLVRSIPPRTLDSICSGNKMTVSQIAGTFILRYFYEPAVTMLSQSLKVSSTALYNPRNAGKLEWSQIENVLIVFRFVREISDTVGLGTDEFKIDPAQGANLRKLIITAIEEGNPTVHMQLLRLLYKSAIPNDERSHIISEKPCDLSLNHFIGASECEAIRIQLRKDITRPKTASQKKDPTVDQRWSNIANALDPNHLMSSSTSFTALQAMSQAVQPSRFTQNP
ncbi:hypothetical protein TRFO_43090 [Tritrichomonas foetus]|uniref:Uncharacterized protein n=1 Tax=Tritrichomonas foetus TaxID=1144522 RepID=A0A1J4KXB2_9EUKA|nr:hypothetical protein TRFO_43090 [Tritrichomonas foetus]|eukprot:OHT14342.1 hypothetical protein TRFO_43090 [Tritrichomonas foetus]